MRLRHHVRLNFKNSSLHRSLLTYGQKEHSVQLLVQERALQLAQDSLDFQHHFVERCTHVTTIAWILLSSLNRSNRSAI